MKYFNIEIQETNGVAAAAIYGRDSKDEAVTSFHTSMASMRAAVDQGNLSGATGMVINQYGGVETPYIEYYVKSVSPTPTPDNTENDVNENI